MLEWGGRGRGSGGVRGGEGRFARRVRGVLGEEGVWGGDVGESECDMEEEEDDEGA